MGIKVRLKTGFFETTPYRLEVESNRLCFFSSISGSEAMIALHEDDIISVTLQEKHPQFVIETDSFHYRGAFLSYDDWIQALYLIKNKLNVKIICEYEGGSHETDRYT